MRFPQSFLDEIRARVSISSVIGRSVQWDKRKTNAGKGDFWACCPFHGEKSASFHCEDRKGRYHCFGCKVSGDIFTYLVEKEGVPFPEAVERLAMEAGLEMPKLSPEAEAREERRSNLYDVMQFAQDFFASQLQSAAAAKARGYLSDRGLSAGVQQDFAIGYAPNDRHALSKELARHKVTPEQMVEAGLVIKPDDGKPSYDRFRDRIMFPIRDPRGRVIAFGGRAMSADAMAKYLNSPDTPLFHKGTVLYNQDKARKAAHDTGQLIACEGYMDVIAFTRAGLPNAVAPLGTALTEDQLGLMWRMVPEPVLCFDGDEAGLKAAWRALDLALERLTPGNSLRFVLLPGGQDPDDLLGSGGPEAVRQAIEAAEPMADMLWRRALSANDRSTPERKARFEADLMQLVNQIGDPTVRKYYQDDMRERVRALFGRAGATRTGMRRMPAGQQGGRRGRFQQLQPWEMKLPASPQLKALASRPAGEAATERRTGFILLTLVNHPVLAEDMIEDLAALEGLSPTLDSLRRRIIDTIASGADLETSGLRDHLIHTGMGAVIDALDSQARHHDCWFAGADAADRDARTGLKQLLALNRKLVTLEKELRRAELRLAEHPSEENLNLLNEVREQLQSMTGAEASVDGYGEASGRISNPAS
ncbi:MAG: DNA primase [Anderseniella sp.]|jgi:DNA primase|nr:DNA primase [Anderseniella sp.]